MGNDQLMSGGKCAHPSRWKRQPGRQPEPLTIGYENAGNGGDGYADRMVAKYGSDLVICGVLLGSRTDNRVNGSDLMRVNGSDLMPRRVLLVPSGSGGQ
jgi:hypothetical protein